MRSLGAVIMIAGAVLLVAGLVILAGERLHLGRLPGDLHFEGRHGTLRVPITTALLISLLLTLVLNVVLRLFRR